MRWTCLLAVFATTAPRLSEGETLEEIMAKETYTWEPILTDPGIEPKPTGSPFNSHVKRKRGNVAFAGQFPHHAYLNYDGRFSCGGSVIHKRYVLTAAYPILMSKLPNNATGWKVWLAHFNERIFPTMIRPRGYAWQDRDVNVEKFLVRPYIKRSPETHLEMATASVALVKTATDMPLNDWIKPIRLPKPEEYLKLPGSQNIRVVTLGYSTWGSPGSENILTDSLHYISLLVQQDGKCQKSGLTCAQQGPGRLSGQCLGDPGSGVLGGDGLSGLHLKGVLVSVCCQSAACPSDVEYLFYPITYDIVDWIYGETNTLWVDPTVVKLPESYNWRRLRARNGLPSKREREAVSHPVQRISGVSPNANEEFEFPYVVALRNRSNWDKVCGGSILSKRWVLTSARCVTIHSPTPKQADPSLFWIWLADKEAWTQQLLLIATIRLHPLYDMNVTHWATAKDTMHDIALIRTREAFKFNAWVLPIPLASTEQMKEFGINTNPQEYDRGVRMHMTLTGWGLDVDINETPTESGVLHFTSVQMQPWTSRCNPTLPRICAVPTVYATKTSTADLGSGIVGDPSYRMYPVLMGIFSSTTADKPEKMEFENVYYHAHWIWRIVTSFPKSP